jgi:hypothetical protein
MFLNLFGKKNIDKKKEDVNVSSSTLDAIFKLKETLALQEKKEEFLEKTIEKLKNDAREQLKQNKKNKAINILKMCKMKEKNLEQLYGIKSNLESQIFALEQALNNEVVIKSIKHGKKALDNFKTSYDVDDTAELMDEINEHMVMSSEIGDILSQPIGGTTYDGDDLLNELREEDDIKVITSLPDIKPKTKPIIVEDEDEKALKELEKEFNFPDAPSEPIKIKNGELLS